ncbi:restriction endonuclease type II-like protein [Glomus cerebriforme]|uniref:Restriction endonuclease type II-like protein n=1 Tax=Glomus cerebriforme TaxID=658196 RepID=A0A397SH74_9GLOM|nr:restriction endonuclease type II-like protein [Glomus cerebriforme]
MASTKDFEELAKVIPNCYRMNLSEGKIEVVPVHHNTGRREAILGNQITAWCLNNMSLVGEFGGPNTGWTLPLPDTTVRCPDYSVVLIARWNTLSNADREEAFPAIAPNFVVEIRSQSDTEDKVHENMIMWMNAGVEEGFSIDPFTHRARIYSIMRHQIHWREYANPTTLTSNVLNGFVLNLQGII